MRTLFLCCLQSKAIYTKGITLPGVCLSHLISQNLEKVHLHNVNALWLRRSSVITKPWLCEDGKRMDFIFCAYMTIGTITYVKYKGYQPHDPSLYNQQSPALILTSYTSHEARRRIKGVVNVIGHLTYSLRWHTNVHP